jgi:hypothetical protein
MTITNLFMATLKTILDTRRKKADGTYAVIFRITDYWISEKLISL